MHGSPPRGRGDFPVSRGSEANFCLQAFLFSYLSQCPSPIPPPQPSLSPVSLSQCSCWPPGLGVAVMESLQLFLVVPTEGDREPVNPPQPTEFESHAAADLFMCAYLMSVPGVWVCASLCVCVCLHLSASVCVSCCRIPPHPQFAPAPLYFQPPGFCVCFSLSLPLPVSGFLHLGLSSSA